MFVLYTHRLFIDGLGANKPIVLTSWINGQLSRPNVNLFPTKLLRGFAGHRFGISSIHQPPYVVKKLSTDAAGNIAIHWDGLEFRILNLLSLRLNFTYDISEPAETNDLGYDHIFFNLKSKLSIANWSNFECQCYTKI